MTIISRIKAKYEQALADGTPINFEAIKDCHFMVTPINATESEVAELVKLSLQDRESSRAREDKFKQSVIKRSERDDETTKWCYPHPYQSLQLKYDAATVDLMNRMREMNGWTPPIAHPIKISKSLYDQLGSIANDLGETN
jgi:hypothetical protein